MKYIISFLLVAFTLPAFSTVGGVAVVCRNTEHKILSAQLLDLYEGEIRFQRSYDHSYNIDQKIIWVQRQKIESPIFLSDFKKTLVQIKSKIIFVPDGVGFNLSSDVNPFIVKKDCQFEQLINHDINGDILVSQEIYDQFKNADQAALYIHLTIQKLFETKGAENSLEARKLTSMLLAIPKLKEESDINSLINRNYLIPPCGLTGSVDARIKDCSLTKTGFVLVTRTNELKEVYKEIRSGLLWSDRLPNSMNYYEAMRACNGLIPEAGGLSQNKYTWRLPTIQEYRDAGRYSNLYKELPNMDVYTYGSLWSSDSVSLYYRFSIWVYDGRYYGGGSFQYTGSIDSGNYGVRCVGTLN